MIKSPNARQLIAVSLAIFYLSPAIAQSNMTDNLTETKQGIAAHSNHLTIHKDPNCSCCSAWVLQLPASFTTTLKNTNNINLVKDKLKVAQQYRSCHTAVSDSGFVFEGHIPNTAIQAFLAKPPANALGLAVPGMPIGSPGMEVENHTMRYPIYLLMKDGTQTIYAYATGSQVTFL